MSIFQCEKCGCAENTALTSCGHQGYLHELLDWKGLEDFRGKLLCSACQPALYIDGAAHNRRGWHGAFPRVFLPKGEFHTDKRGNLIHTKTGSPQYIDFAIPNPAGA